MKTYLLNHNQIIQKIKRIAYQIEENNLEVKTLYIGGIGERGGLISQLICNELKKLREKKGVVFFQINTVNKSNEVDFSLELMQLKGKHVIVVDDVLNTGKTLMNVLVPIVEIGAERIETVFLVQRNHRQFPVIGDFVGMSLATTFQEHVYFDASDEKDLKAYLA